MFLRWMILLIFLSAPVLAQETQVSSYVQDNANIFSSDQVQGLEQTLRDFEQKTSVQYVIFTTSNIPQDTSLEEYSLQIAEKNKIGYEGHDNGLLFLIAVNDRQYRWETGYGIEDVLNSAYLGRVSREEMVPYFQQGDFASGIIAGSQVVMARIQGADDEDVFAREQKQQREQTISSIILFIVLTIIIISVVSQGTRRRRNFDDGELPTYMYLGAATGMFKGGFGGGGLGGFSGGGGGFGGGGFGGSF